MSREHTVIRVASEPDFHSMLDVFQHGFEDDESYGREGRPSSSYIQGLLQGDSFVGLIATRPDGRAVGALAAYVLRKFEKERAEIYIYDLAVDSSFRRMGVATSLIEELRNIGRAMGAYVLFVQADKAPDDMPAQALYRKLGTEEDVFHYDIQI